MIETVWVEIGHILGTDFCEQGCYSSIDSIYLYSTISPELKFCSEVLDTTLHFHFFVLRLCSRHCWIRIMLYTVHAKPLFFLVFHLCSLIIKLSKTIFFYNAAIFGHIVALHIS